MSRGGRRSRFGGAQDAIVDGSAIVWWTLVEGLSTLKLWMSDSISVGWYVGQQ